MKHFLFVSLCIAITVNLAAQGLTRYGQITTGLSNDFVDKYGRLSSVPMLDANGKVLFELTTTEVSAITDNTASSGGAVFSVDPLTARGVCWSTGPNPLVTDNHTDEGTSLGAFTSSITGLTCGTQYYVRAYATNSFGTGYGNEISFIATTIPMVTSLTGRIWMDRNLGASQVATSSTDFASYGDLYQWGRGADGHQIRTSTTTTTLSGTDVPGHDDFILPLANPYDWRSPQNNNLWQGVNGINNPCPCGFRLPTNAEWDAELLSWMSQNSAGAFASPLKLTLAGDRHYNGAGEIWDAGVWGSYWSSNGVLFFGSPYAITSVSARSIGHSVRCIKD